MQGYNLFAYCLNNPVNFSDPTGHWPDWGTLLGGVVTVLVGVAAVAAVVGTGGAATPLVALGLASIGAAGLARLDSAVLRLWNLSLDKILLETP